MKFLMNGAVALLNRLLYQNDGGHILQLRICMRQLDSTEIFESILSALEKNNVAVMEDKKPDSEGYAEIRVLMGLELPTILSIMAHGVSVIQAE
jgi:hypothetical protein